MPDPITEREKTLASVFYHPRTGFGSVEQTLKQARIRDASITRQHVRDFIAKQEIRQRRKPLKVNSFVAEFPRQEFQVDLLDMGEKAVPRYGFVAIDIFSKKGACFPIRSKLASETAEALRKTFGELGYPSSIMCDEGGEFQGEFAEECKKEDVEIIRSRTGGRFVERFIRTLKLPIFERRKALGGNWTQYVQDVVDGYNDTEHASIHEKPSFVAEHEYNNAVVTTAHSWQMRHAKFPVTHNKINVGDHVKIRIKPTAFYKETFNSWSPEVYTVERIDADTPQGKLYHLVDYRRPLLRFELKKIADVHRYVGGELRSSLHEVQHPPAAPAPAAGPPPVRPPPPPANRPITRSVAAASVPPVSAAAAGGVAAANDFSNVFFGGSGGSSSSSALPRALPLPPRPRTVPAPVVPRVPSPPRRPMTRSQTKRG